MSEVKKNEERRVSRRRFLGYAGGAVAVVAAGVGGYYLASSRPSPVSVTTTAVPVSVTTTASGTATKKPIEIWWTTQFFATEQLAFLEVANSFTAETGIPVHVTFYDFEELIAKIFTSAQAGTVPDISNDLGDATGTRLASQDYLLDISDIIKDVYPTDDTQQVAFQIANVPNKAGKLSYYQLTTGLAPCATHYWSNYLEKYAGVKMPPNDWEGFWGAFEKAQDNGAMRDLKANAYAWTLFSTGSDAEDAFSETLAAFGGQPLTSDGKVNYNDPAFKKAARDTAAFAIDKYKKGYIPAGSTAWDDSSNNVAIESKKALMVYCNLSFSIALWFKNNAPDDYKDNIYTMGYPPTQPLPNGPNGNKFKGFSPAYAAYIMKDAVNPGGANAFLRYFMKKDNYHKWLDGYGHRVLPVYKSSLNEIPIYQDSSDHNFYVQKFMPETYVADYRYVNPVWAQASRGEYIWSNIVTGVLTKGADLDTSVDNAFARLETLAKQAGQG